MTNNLAEKYKRIDEDKIYARQTKANEKLANIYSYADEVNEAIYLLSGDIDTEGYSFRNFAPSDKINPSVICIRKLLLSIHYIRGHNNNCSFNTNFYNTHGKFDTNSNISGTEIMTIYKNKALIESFFNVLVKPAISDHLTRKYKLTYNKEGDPILVAEDETVNEYMEREFNVLVHNKLIFTIPLLGQILLIIYFYYYIYALFTKNKSK